MAHNLATKADGTAAMAYTGETPWHGLGTAVAGAMTAAEAIHAGGLDYAIGLHSMFLDNGKEVPGCKAVVREDNGAILSNVGNGWKPIQNAEAFAFLDGVAGEEFIKYHTVGALGAGERIWLLAKLDGDIVIRGTDDVTKKFLLLSNAHTGNESLRCMFTPIRVVCQNTLNAALGGVCTNSLRIRHTGDLAAKIGEARRVLGLADKFYGTFQEQADFLAGAVLKPAEVDAYFARLFPDPEDAEKQKRAQSIAESNRNTLRDLFESSPGNQMKGVRGTAWAAYNAATYYVDHVRPSRGELGHDKASMKMERNWFGWWAGFKGRAWDFAVETARGADAPAPEPAVVSAPAAKPKAVKLKAVPIPPPDAKAPKARKPKVVAV